MVVEAALVKFCADDYMSQFRDEGLLYMNILPYFWGIEDEELRGDPCDSVEKIERGRRAEFRLPDGTKLPEQATKWEWRVPPPNADRINVFCMYALRPSVRTFPVHEKNFRFGDLAIVVTNIEEFIGRVSRALADQQIVGSADLVEYVDDEYTGDVGPFRKLTRFAYQSEWRLVCRNGPGGARELRIGSIKDISIVMPTREINERITVCS